MLTVLGQKGPLPGDARVAVLTEDDFGRAVAAGGGGRGIGTGDGRMVPEMRANGSAQPAAAVAVDHPDPLAAGRQGAVQVGVEGFQGRFDLLADEQQFRLHRVGLRPLDPDPAGRRGFSAGYRRKVGARRSDPLAADQHGRLIAAKLHEFTQPAQRAVADAGAKGQGTLLIRPRRLLRFPIRRRVAIAGREGSAIGRRRQVPVEF